MTPILQRFRLRWPSLHTGIMAAVLMICALLVGLDGWRSWQARSTAIADDKTETANLARSLAQHAHDLIQLSDTLLVGFRERVETGGLSSSSAARLSALMAKCRATLPTIYGMAVFDAAGASVASSRPNALGALDIADRAFFQHHRTHPDRGLHIGKPVWSKATGAQVVTLSRRFDRPDGSFGGIVAAQTSVNALESYYRTFDIGPSGAIALISGHGIILARASAYGGSTGTDVSAGEIFRDFLPHAPVGSFRYVSAIDGVTRLGSYRRVAGYPLVTLVAHGLGDVLASWRVDAMVHLAVNLAACALLIACGHVFAREIKRRHELERHYRLLADNSSDAIICFSLDGRRLYASPVFSAMTGWSAEESLARSRSDLIHPDDLHVLNPLLAGAVTQLTCRYRYLCKNGDYLWVEARIRRAAGEHAGPAQFVANISDISDRKAAEDRVATLTETLAAQANTDGLTGLANRRRFDEALDQEWRRSVREETPLSLVLIDIDHFKLYNDCYGHQKGDECLRMVATIIAEFARRPGDVAARYGGEEIAVLLPGTHAEGAAELAGRICAAIQSTRIEHAGDARGVVTASLGVATIMAVLNDDANACLDLVAAADSALYAAKHQGRNQVVAPDLPPTSWDAGTKQDISA